FSEKFNFTVFLEFGRSDLRHTMKAEQADHFCSWLAASARCHLMELFSADEDDVRRYQKLWNEFFFAPLFVAQASTEWRFTLDDIHCRLTKHNPEYATVRNLITRPFKQKPLRLRIRNRHTNATVLWDLLEGGKSARKLACVEIHEGLFRQESAKAATALLDAKLQDAREVTQELFQVAREALGIRVPHWLSRHEEGESPRLQQERRPRYVEELESVQVELVALHGVTTTDYTMSVYSWEARYDYDRNVLVVPHGLLALMADATESIEPITSVLVSAQMMWWLLPQPYSPYSWT
ncbi:hypothetical protein V5799_005828, partial [Amblyomma americanum]